jgi:hypothetical protein
MAETKREHDVVREFTVYDELPPGNPRASQLEDALALVQREAPQKFVCIAEYNTPAAASGAATNLRRRHGGDPTVDGWQFHTRKLENKRTGLLVHWDGSKIEPGKLADQLKIYGEFKKVQNAKAKMQAQKRAEKERAAKADAKAKAPAAAK